MKAENRMRWEYWLSEAIQIFNRWQQDKTNETLWGAFCCCSACMVEYDRKHSEPETQKIQALGWGYAWVRGERTLEEYQNSGYFNEDFYKKFCKTP